MSIESSNETGGQQDNSIFKRINELIDAFKNADGNGLLEKFLNALKSVNEETHQQLADLSAEVDRNPSEPTLTDTLDELGDLASTFVIGDSIAEGISHNVPNGIGFTGKRTEFILQKLQESLPSLASSITSITIYAGINDIWGSDDSSINSAASNIARMGELVKSTGREPILCTIHNIEVIDDDKKNRIQQLNEKIREIAVQNGYRLVDFANSSFSSHGIHPTSSGYQEMTEQIALTLNSSAA